MVKPAATLFALGLVAMIGGAAAHAQSGNQAAGIGQPSTPSATDQKFLDYAAEDNQAEIQLCLSAEKRAHDPALKAFARLMVNDHVAIESRLAALGDELRAGMPDGIGKEGEQTRAKLAPLQGEAFERQFMQAQIKDHSDDIEKFSQELEDTQNARIRQFATETVPILKQHLALARAVQGGLEAKLEDKAGGSTTGQSGKP